jgi:hypothetical protein
MRLIQKWNGKPCLRIFGPLLICAVGVGATALPASAASVQPVRTAVSDYHYHHPHGYGGPLSPAGLLACAEHLGLPNPQQLVQEMLQEGLVHVSLYELGQEAAGGFLLGATLAYPVFDFWFNCVAPYVPISAQYPAPTAPGNPGGPVAPTPPFYTLGG